LADRGGQAASADQVELVVQAVLAALAVQADRGVWAELAVQAVPAVLAGQAASVARAALAASAAQGALAAPVDPAAQEELAAQAGRAAAGKRPIVRPRVQRADLAAAVPGEGRTSAGREAQRWAA
jgi:hypothetical protein